MSKTSTKFLNHRNDTNIPLTSVLKLIVRSVKEILESTKLVKNTSTVIATPT